MTDEERFMADLNGYLVIKNVLDADELAEMNDIADRLHAGDDSARRGRGRVCLWGEPFKALVDHPKVTPYIEELLGP